MIIYSFVLMMVVSRKPFFDHQCLPSPNPNQLFFKLRNKHTFSHTLHCVKLSSRVIYYLLITCKINIVYDNRTKQLYTFCSTLFKCSWDLLHISGLYILYLYMYISLPCIEVTQLIHHKTILAWGPGQKVTLLWTPFHQAWTAFRILN